MKKELLFPQDCDGEQYLRRLIDAYPYDIEEARVLALLTAQPHPSPYLLEFLTYAATLSFERSEERPFSGHPVSEHGRPEAKGQQPAAYAALWI